MKEELISLIVELLTNADLDLLDLIRQILTKTL